jgi:hypothetical protein
MQTALPHRREAFRLWFEYLRVAHVSEDEKVREALKRSASFYAPWGDVMNTKFEYWWKEKGHLFEEKYAVRRLTAGELPKDSQALIVEIPLTQSPTVLIERVAAIIHEATASLPRQSTKSKKASTAQFQLTAGSEPKLAALREMLNVYSHVYLKHSKARGKELLKEMRAYYENRKRNRLVPNPLDDTKGTLENKMRNIRRYITNAGKVVLNVARGEFPGEY